MFRWVLAFAVGLAECSVLLAQAPKPTLWSLRAELAQADSREKQDAFEAKKRSMHLAATVGGRFGLVLRWLAFRYVGRSAP